MSRAEEKRIRARTRAALVEVARLWCEQKGIDGAELVFRMKTAPVREEPVRTVTGREHRWTPRARGEGRTTPP